MSVKYMGIEEWRQFLTDAQIVELQRLSQNSELIEALTRVLCHDIYNNGVLKKEQDVDFSRNFLLNFITVKGAELSNEKLGEDVRSYWWGLHALEQGLKELKKFGQEEKVAEPENPAV